MKRNQKKTISYTGICYTTARDDQPIVGIVEAYGSDKDTVLKKTLAAALCYGEHNFIIETAINQRPVMLERYAVTDATAAQYTATGKVRF